MNYLEFYQQLSVLELLCGTIDETHCYQKSQHEEQKKNRKLPIDNDAAEQKPT